MSGPVQHPGHQHPRTSIRRLLPQVRSDLEALVRIPSVGTDPAALLRSAELTARLLRDAGAAETRILAEAGSGGPAVLARWPVPAGQPLVLLYAHHDVQPPGDLDDWTTPPFGPAERGGRLYGRGTADDKAGIAAHLAAVRAYDGRPPVGVTMLVEGEEEAGSPTLGSLLARHREELAADVIVLADGDNIQPGRPSFTTTLRGLAACVVEVRALARGVHSGSFGGAAPDALTALCRLLATLHDPRGDVAVAGLTTAPMPGFRYAPASFRADAGMLAGVSLLGSGQVAEQIWTKPAATVLAIDAPAVTGASNTLTPTARAKVGLRLAPGDDPVRAARALARHLRRHAPWGVHVDVTEAELARPFAVDPHGPAYDAAHAAYREAYDAEAVHIGGGGAIPFASEFAAAFPRAAILITSAGADGDSNPHGPDESLGLADFARACLAEALLLGQLCKPGKRT
jgi:cysteinylglycine-S-conjugate dipeptidase